MSIELAKKYLSARAMDTSNKGVKKMLREGILDSVLPTSEVMAVLEMTSKRKLKAFIKNYNKNHPAKDVI